MNESMDEVNFFKRFCYPELSGQEIQILIDSANEFEIERRIFVLSLPQKEKTKKQIKTAVGVNGVLVYQN